MARRRQTAAPTAWDRFWNEFWEFGGDVVLAVERILAMWLLIKAHHLLDEEFRIAGGRFTEVLQTLEAATVVGFSVIYLVLLIDAVRLFSSDLVTAVKGQWKGTKHEQQRASSTRTA